MVIKTADILPGEPGYISKKKKTEIRKKLEKENKRVEQKKEVSIGKIKIGFKGYRIGKPIINSKSEKKYPIWRYSKKIGEITVKNKNMQDEEIDLRFNRLGSIGNYKHLIQDEDFKMKWAVREQELLITQNECYICKKKLSKSAIPNLYHAKMWQKRAQILEKASEVPKEVISGKLTIEEGWEKFNNILEDGNRYYMSLEDTALICSSCAKAKGLVF